MKLDAIKDPQLRAKILELDRIQNPNRRILGGLEAKKPQPNPAPPLAGKSLQFKSGKKGVGVCVTLCSHRRRLLDSHDNLRSSTKPLVDAIAKTIGLDDADPRIVWQYHQLQTKGREGVVVTLERL
jgi:hypothetical protein